MSLRPRVPSLNDHYCQVCSLSPTNEAKHLSCFSCDHCKLSMCYECFEKHTSKLIEEYNQLQKRFLTLINLFERKRQFFGQFQEHCIRCVNSAFDEAVNDLEYLRRESINYVQQQFEDAELVISEMETNVKPLMAKAEENWTRDGITKNVMLEIDLQRKQVNDIEKRLDIFSSPNMRIKIATYPRNKLDLHCQPLIKSYATTKKFSPIYPGKIISTDCSFVRNGDLKQDKIDVETVVEELSQNLHTNKQTQTEPMIDSNYDIDEDDYYLQDENEQVNSRLTAENCLSRRFIAQGTILTQNEVDRIASDGENLLYYSETSRSLCYISDFISSKQANATSLTKEISCRWPHHSILDLIYSPASSKFVCATKTGVYTCTINGSTIDIQLQLTQSWTYVRLGADKNFIWLWVDTIRSSQLRTYSPRTFDCIKIFNLNDYPRFVDNSTSFCVEGNILATLFQFKQAPNIQQKRKIFHLTFCDNIDLRELCTIRLGECEIDHEVRSNNTGLFFITNGRRKLWIVDQNGKKEYVNLASIGRALTVNNKNQIIIANGTQQLQCVELS